MRIRQGVCVLYCMSYKACTTTGSGACAVQFSVYPVSVADVAWIPSGLKLGSYLHYNERFLVSGSFDSGLWWSEQCFMSFLRHVI